MHNERTNLLPPERQRALSRDYLMRLGVITAILLTVLVFAAILLSIPTYMFLAKSMDTKEKHLAHIESAFSSAEEKALSARLAALSGDAALLIALGKTPSASATIRNALAVAHTGVTLSGFTYTPAAPKVPATLKISGNAATRDVLRGYQIALSSAPFAASADLPVSTYAKDTNISFTIIVTLAS